MIKDLLFLSINNIRRRKLRSWLSIIGIFIGVAAVVSLISLSQGLNEAVSEQFKKIGTDKIVVNNGAAFGPPGALENKLDLHDIEVVKNTKGVETATGVVDRFVNVKFNSKTSTLVLHGVSLDKDEYKLMEEVQSVSIEKGRSLKSKDKNKVLIGYSLANEDTFFSKKLKLNDKIIINDKKIEIVGIIKKIGSPFEDAHLIAPLETVNEIFDIKNKYDTIFVRTKKSFLPDEVKEKIKENLRKDRNLKKGNEDFKVQTFESITNTFNSIFSIIQAIVIGIVSISLLVGSIGIMNTMYTSVLERTKEIGIMKAVGARNSHILLIFLFESAFLGFAGGIIGTVIGFGLSKIVELSATFYLGITLVRTVVNTSLISGVLLISIIIGSLAGILPALQASRLKPVDALRYE